jgi:hypothetical protein
MRAVVLLRELWRHRMLVLAGALLAVIVAVLTAFKVSPPLTLQSRSYEVGVASTTALVDTPTSQVVDLGDSNDNSAGALPGRAALLASLLSTSPLKDDIAKKAGIDPHTLIAGSPDTGGAAAGAAAGPVGSISPKDPHASFLTVTTLEGLPILSVDVQAPDVQTAARLSNGAIEVLQANLSSLASSDSVPEGRRLVVKQLGAARVGAQKRGPSRVLAVFAGFLVFALVCAGILGLSWLARSWRQMEALERLPSIDWPTLDDYAEGVAEPAPVHYDEPAPETAMPPPEPAQPARERWGVAR